MSAVNGEPAESLPPAKCYELSEFGQMQKRIAELEAENKRLRDLVGKAFDKGYITWGDPEALKDLLKDNGLGEG